jgi:hypothetical protein
MWWRVKEWALRVTEPWLEERASLMLEWRIFAQKHNARYPGDIQCVYQGIELDDESKAHMYEFPKGDSAAPPDVLEEQYHRTVDRLG